MCPLGDKVKSGRGVTDTSGQAETEASWAWRLSPRSCFIDSGGGRENGVAEGKACD